MLNINKLVIVSIALSLSSNIFAKDEIQVIDRGLDGGKRTYLIVCPDGNQGTVSNEFDIKNKPEVSADDKSDHIGGVPPMSVSIPPKLIKVCIENTKGDEKCQTSWKLDSAAKAVCS